MNSGLYFWTSPCHCRHICLALGGQVVMSGTQRQSALIHWSIASCTIDPTLAAVSEVRHGEVRPRSITPSRVRVFSVVRLSAANSPHCLAAQYGIAFLSFLPMMFVILGFADGEPGLLPALRGCA